MTRRRHTTRLPAANDKCTPRPRTIARPAAKYAPLFKALADATRLEILGLLAAANGELCVCDIESHFDLSQPTISHHLRLLREAELVHSTRRGTWVHYSLNRDLPERLRECAAILGANRVDGDSKSRKTTTRVEARESECCR